MMMIVIFHLDKRNYFYFMDYSFSPLKLLDLSSSFTISTQLSYGISDRQYQQPHSLVNDIRSFLDRMENMEEVVKMIMDLIDTVANVHLSPKAAAASTKVRAEMNEQKMRDEHKERQEVCV